MAAKRRVPDRETVTTERVAMVAHLLMVRPGLKLTTADVARRVEMTHNGAWRMLSVMSRVIPLVQDLDGWYYWPDGDALP